MAGGNGSGNECTQLRRPQGIYLDYNQTLYIADSFNHRIIEWKSGATTGRIVAGGNGQGNRDDQLNDPADVIVHRDQECLIICDRGNRRLVRWSLHEATSGETVIANIDCNCLTMDENRYLYITDIEKHQVIRWKLGETQETIVAGGNGRGNRLDQLDYPTFVFVDRDRSVYVSDFNNHRVMKWMVDGREGSVVAGGKGNGDSLAQSSYPGGVIVDQWGGVYVADSATHRIMCWPKDAKEGRLIAGGTGTGMQSKNVHRPAGLSFDQYGNLYTAEYGNHRIQRFEINTMQSVNL